MYSTTVREDEIIKVGDVIIHMRRLRDGWCTLGIHAPKELRIEKLAPPLGDGAPPVAANLSIAKVRG